MFQISDQPINRDLAIQALQNVKAGGLVVFEGWVRDHNEGKPVTSLEYQVYTALAQKEGDRILQEARHRFNLHSVFCVHRSGHLRLGDIAVWVGAVASHRDDAFKASRFIIDQIKHRLPIWKKEHYQNQAPEWVFCKDHHTHVHFQEKDYYQKQVKLTNQSVLKNSRVLVVGAGGLGCPALMSLAAAGVGHLKIVDFDQIEISNIHRQALYSPGLVGEKKALIAQKRLIEMNPFIEVTAEVTHVNIGNVMSLLHSSDLVLDCTDNMRTKFLLHDACFQLQIPLIQASVFQFEGQVRTFIPGSEAGCWRCSVAQTPDDSLLGNCNDFGVLSSTVGVLGNLQASEALFLLQNQTNNTLHETFFMDLKSLRSLRLKNRAKDNCLCCQGLLPLEVESAEVLPQDLGPDYQLLDIRNSPDEVLHSHLTSHLNSLQKVAVLCHRGVRSLRLVQRLRAQGHVNFFSVSGGFAALAQHPLTNAALPNGPLPNVPLANLGKQFAIHSSESRH